MSKFTDIVLGDTNCVAYWPLTADGVALKGGINLNLTDVTFLNGMAYFNGTSSNGASASAIDLSTSNKITVLAKVKFATYSLTAAQAIIEHTVSAFAASAGGFLLYQDGTNADKGIAFGGQCNVSNEARYSNATFSWSTKGELFFACTFDTTVAGALETNVFSNGAKLTATSRTSNNNTAGFSSAITYIGARAGTSLFTNAYISNVAIFNRILTGNEIETLYRALLVSGTSNRYIGQDFIPRRSLSRYWTGHKLIHSYPLSDSGNDELGGEDLSPSRFVDNSAYFDELEISSLLNKSNFTTTVLMYVKEEGGVGYELKSFKAGSEECLYNVYVREVLIFNEDLDDFSIADYDKWAMGTNRMAY